MGNLGGSYIYIYIKPLPAVDLESRQFWEGCRKHKLVLQRCEECGRFRFYPRPFCPGCLSSRTEVVKASGRGAVYSFSIIHRPPRPAFKEDVPYVLALVELEEGVRLITNLVGCQPHDVRIGMPVEVEFDDVTPTVTLPKFRPRFTEALACGAETKATSHGGSER